MLKTASLIWDDKGRLYSKEYDDIYFQPKKGIEESNYVFLQANNLKEKFSALKSGDVFRIAELGFGSGLNFLLTFDLWAKHAPKGARLVFISFEKHPILKKDLKEIYSHWAELNHLSEKLLKLYPKPAFGFHTLDFTNVKLILGLGEAEQLLTDMNTKIDTWFLDGFAPAKNPDMWDSSIFKHMQRLTNTNGSFSTFTAAGHVKRELEGSGFSIKKIDGYGNKRNMLTGEFIKKPIAQKTNKPKHVMVIGAGIAGCSAACALASRGIKVTIFEEQDKISAGASGNTIGVSYPRLTADCSAFGMFYAHAFCHTIKILNKIGKSADWVKSGTLMLDYDETSSLKNKNLYKKSPYSEVLFKYLSKEDACNISGIEINCGGIFYPDAGYVSPPKFCQALLDTYPDLITINTSISIDNIELNGKTWSLFDKEKQEIATTEHLIIASGTKASKYNYTKWLPLQYVGGQVSYIKATKQSSKLKTVIAHKGYIPPAFKGVHYAGSTFIKLENANQEFKPDKNGHIENLKNLSEQLPSLAINETPDKGRGQIRTTTPDHLPIIGEVPILSDWNVEFSNITKGKIKLADVNLNTGSYFSGLYITGAFGSHGMTSAPLAGEIIAAKITGDPIPLTTDAIKAVHAGRFILRNLKKANNNAK